jgi:hypothetical protein
VLFARATPSELQVGCRSIRVSVGPGAFMAAGIDQSAYFAADQVMI